MDPYIYYIMTFKKINPKEIEFYVMEISSVRFVIFDSKFDVPIYNGSWNMVEGIIKNIKEHTKNASIYYYTKQKSGFLKLEAAPWSYNI